MMNHQAGRRMVETAAHLVDRFFELIEDNHGRLAALSEDFAIVIPEHIFVAFVN